MSMFSLRAVLILLAGVWALASGTWSNPVIEELEQLLVDTNGFNDAGFQKAITPCTNYVSGSQILGRETAAQWVRVAFHDFVTANVKAGTGGIDASIGFETLRPENSGAAMNDSLAFFAPFVNARVSMADMIALSVIMSVGTCSSPSVYIPLRGGRIDATMAGPLGVPEPETDIDTTLAEFSQAGFSQQAAIGLTVCGHTLGSVHHAGFPQVVPESAVTPNNTGGGVHFDATPAVFDVDVLNEYLEWTGQRGGPLVTTENITVRSDLRLYLSDNNATLQDLAESSSEFLTTCVELLGRMIDTVPASVQLTEVIVPQEMKPVNISLAVDSNGDLQFSGYIRLLSTAFDVADKVQLSWLSRTGSQSPTFSTSASAAGVGNSSMFGRTFYHFLNTTIDPAAGISAFKVIVTRAQSSQTFTNGATGYPLEDVAIFLSRETTIASDGTLSVKAAVLTAADILNVTAVVSAPSHQMGTLSPTIITSEVALKATSARGLYTIYSAEVPPVANVQQTTVDLLAYSSDSRLYEDAFRWIAL
ncbi:heme peroxidase [Mycena galopus ATCC 62051]|nr:heme peroxidase [Mycena galopus ATCC 62051]